MITQGETYHESFEFTQDDVIKFAELSGDKNPLHLDAEYASKTPFKKPVIHGVLGSSIFSKILGMKFPGEGTIYLKQELSFKRPMYVDTKYEAILTVKEIISEKHQALIETKIIEKESGKINAIGEAFVMNKDKI